MYDKRIKIFIITVIALTLVCLLRLIHMQLVPNSSLQDDIARLKRERGSSRQLKTIRGKILDRNDRELAADQLKFQLCITYQLSSVADQRIGQGKLSRAKKISDDELNAAKDEVAAQIEDLYYIIDKCSFFGVEQARIEERIEKINNRIWNLRLFQAWRKSCTQSEFFKKNKDNLLNIKASDVTADFEKQIPDVNERLELLCQTNVAEMHKSYPLLELKTDDDIFSAQLEFMAVNGIAILPKANRYYPRGSAAAQTIGWVSPGGRRYEPGVSKEDLKYIPKQFYGRENIEYVCDSTLRGRSGEVFYDIDGRRVETTKPQFGQDVKLTLDIELQKRIEDYLIDPNLNSNWFQPSSVVVLDVATTEVLALVSTPTFDLNRIRYDYASLAADPNRPLLNRAINKQYPPGSVIKPLILIAGLESGKITADEIISCPAHAPKKGWPRCWIQKRHSWKGHDDEGPNNARNAIKGSCNIYFSQLANRIEPPILQKWLYDLGYGRNALADIEGNGQDRRLRQLAGVISSGTVRSRKAIVDFNSLAALKKSDRRWFGIGQGDLRVTPLQVANAMATIARAGVYKKARLFITDMDDSELEIIESNVSAQTLNTVRAGMSAVVNDIGGTAHSAFINTDFDIYGVNVYGKTGSTEGTANAWFAGFAEDNADRAIALAVVVEGGQHGSTDAAPLGREIIRFCIEAGYLGNAKTE